MLKRYLKNERGLTLIELLAVVVILGIITAIAIPSIGNIIENTRRDAHIANARMLVDAARLSVVQNGIPADNDLTIDELADLGFLPSENIQVPGEDFNYNNTSEVTIGGTAPAFTYRVTLTSGTGTGAVTHVNNVEISTLDRDDIVLQ